MLSRRGFLASLGQLAAGSLAAQGEGLAALLRTLEGGGSGQTAAIIRLLKRRHELLSDSDDGYDLENLGDYLSDGVSDVQTRHLSRVGWNPELMTQSEATAMNTEMRAVATEYTTHARAIEGEITQIDKALWEHRGAVNKVIAPQQKYYDMEATMNAAKTPAAQKRLLEHDLSRMQPPELDLTVVNDVSHVVEGAKAPAFNAAKQTGADALRDMREITGTVTQATKGPRKKDWQEQRKKELLTHTRQQFMILANNPWVRIESSLDKGYGDDRWTIATAFNKTTDEAEKEPLKNEMAELKHSLSLAYPDGEKTGLICHATPGQTGYGEHDHERLTLTNPEFALRECLREAQNTYLKSKNALQPTRKIA